MTSKLLHILLIEDDRDDALLVQKNLVRAFKEHIMLDHATNLSRGMSLLEELGTDLDLILLDVNLPDARNLVGLEAIHREVGDVVPIIMLTGNDDPDLALRAVQGKALDYLPKHELRGTALFRAIQLGLARHEKFVKALTNQSRMQSELDALKKREAKLANQARELEKLAIMLASKTHTVA